jgi:REP element-mobilizing transposase RayT
MEKYKGKYRSESNRLRGWDYSSDGHYFITINTYDRACLFGDIVNGKMILNDFGKIATDEWFKSFEIRQELFLNEFILMPNHLHAIVGLKSERVVTNEHGVNDMESNGTDDTEINGTPETEINGTNVVESNGTNVVESNGTNVMGPVGTHGRASLQVPTSQQIPSFQPNPSSQNVPISQNVPSFQPNPSSQNVPISQNVPSSQPNPSSQNVPTSQNNPSSQTISFGDQFQGKIYQSQPFERKPKSISSFVAGYKSIVLNKIDDYIDARQLTVQKFNRRNPLWQANYYDHIIRNVQSFERIAEYIRMNPENWMV